MKKLALSVAVSAALFLSACGGSGGGSSTPSTSTALSGVAAKGVIQQGIVTAYELVDGAWVERGSATTNDSGQYSLNLVNYKNGIVKLVLSAGTDTRMKCDLEKCEDVAFGQSVALSRDFVLDAVLPNLTTATNIPITPYTHMAAAMIEAKVLTAVTAADISSALSKVSTLAGFDVANTRVIDITDANQLAAASADEKIAAVRGAAIMELTSSQQSIEQVLRDLATTFADGTFSANEAISITALVNAFETALADSSLTANLGEAVKTELEASTAQIKGQIGSDGTYTPVVNPNVALSAEAQGKALIRDTRSFIYNIINQADKGDFDQPLDALGVNIDAAADVFDRDTAAMTEILGLGIEQMEDALANDDTLRATLKDTGVASKPVTVVSSNGKTLGTLTLTATNYNAVTMSLNGTLEGEQRKVAVDLAVNSNVDLTKLHENSSSQTSLNMLLKGSLSDGSTSLTIDSGTINAVLSAGIDGESDNLDQVVTSLTLSDLVAHIVSAGASFDGKAAFALIRPTGTVSSYFYEDTANLTLKSVALDGAFVTAKKESMKASVELNLLNADTFDLLAFLNGEDEFEIHLDDALSDTTVAALRAATNVASASGWNINYGMSIYSGTHASSTDWNSWPPHTESYDQLVAIYDPVKALQTQFASIPGAEVRYAQVSASSNGGADVWGYVYLPEYDETDSNFLKAQLTTSFDLVNVTGLPEAKVWAKVNRDTLNGGSATLQVSWKDSAQNVSAQNVSYQFRFDGVDVKAKTGNLTISNPYGVKAVFDKVNLTEGSTSGAVYVAGNKVGDITTLDNGLVKIKYTDGTFETLQ